MLTFDMIRDLERTERGSRKLQRMPEDIVAQMREYLKRKERITEKTSSDLMEIENIKSTIKRMFELRETKLLSSVSDTVRTGYPPENMTKDEEEVFYKLVESLKRHREKFFHTLSKDPDTMYRVIKPVPSFVGPDMKNYELRENEIVSIPHPLNELLLKEGIIEKVE
jgi:DNA replication initiation complex subunit (GINS family)